MTIDYRLVGPSAQTNFLGCSITEISMNLAWGSENSSCNVKLVRDEASHENSQNYRPLETAIQSLINQPDNATNSIPTLPGDRQSQQLLKPIAKFENDKNLSHQNNERIGLNSTIIDLGKKMWSPHSDTPFNWTGPDPGFIGELYSIMGIPVQVRFQDLKFSGFIKKWTEDSGIYTVELVSPGSLLKGTKLIINDYIGTISSSIPEGPGVAVPYNDPTANLPFNASLRFGNIPNCINIFGSLENRGFGLAGASEFGVKAADIWRELRDLLNSSAPQPSAFSPYGGIVSRGLMSLNRGLINPELTFFRSEEGQTTNLTQLGLFKTIVSSENIPRCIFRLDFSSVPIPNDNIYYPITSVASVDEFISFCCSGAGCDWNAELLPDNSGYSGVIKINVYPRNFQPTPGVLKNFIRNNINTGNVISANVGEEFNDENVRKIIIGGKQNRLYQVGSSTLSTIRQSKIFNPGTQAWVSTINTMNLGNLRRGSSNNTVKIPLASSQRINYSYKQNNAAVTAQPSLGNDRNYDRSTPSLTSLQDPLEGAFENMSGGSAYPVHLDLVSPFLGRNFNGTPRKVFYDRKRKQLLVNVLVSDLSSASPYVQLNTGVVPTDVSPYITISENEIRAALTGFGAWLEYIFEFSAFDLWLPIGRLILSIITGMSPEGFNFNRTMLRNMFFNFLQGSGGGANNPLTTLNLYGSPGITANTPFFNPLGIHHSNNGLSPAAIIMLSQNIVLPTLTNIHNFMVNELGKYYGKSFLVRLPPVKYYVGSDGVVRYDWEIVDSGWEEKGNFIDDLIEIGSDNDISGSLLSNEDGKFGPIVGWDVSRENVIPAPNFTNAENNTVSQRSIFGDFIKGFGPTPRITTYNPINAPKEGVLVSGRGQKLYVKGKIEDVIPGSKLNTNTKILYDKSLNINYCVISCDPLFLQPTESLGMMTTLDLAALLLEGEEKARYGTSVPDTAFNFNRFTRIAQYANLGSALLFIQFRLFNRSAGIMGPGLGPDIHPRLAVPSFAMIPIQYNQYRYGPWSTAPFLNETNIFPGVANASHWANNVIGGVDVEINPQYVPWEYGGVEALDTAVLFLLNEANQYQQIEESGNMTLAGIMLNDTFIGSRLQSTGPICNSIVVTFGSDGVKTTYSFRTFSRKFGYFNKENADMIQRFNKQQIALKAEFLENFKKGN
jgi:hypothetical protein